MKDIALHTVAAIVMMYLALIFKPGIIFVVALLWLLRELAQADAHNLIAAAAGMKGWSMQKHLEWVVPSLVAAAVYLICPS